MTLRALIAAGAVALVPAPAQAIVIHAPQNYEAQALYQQWADDASVNVPVPATSLRVRLTECLKDDGSGVKDGKACVHYGRWGQIMDFPDMTWTTNAAYANYAGLAPLSARMLFLHELGHVADVQPGPRTQRNAFMGLFGFRRAPLLSPWDVANLPGGVAQPHEWFADAYSLCAIWPHEYPPADALSLVSYDYAPTPEQYERACRIVRALRFR